MSTEATAISRQGAAPRYPAALARAFEKHLEIGGYRGNRGNQTGKTNESAICNDEDAVATANPRVATVATRTAAPLPRLPR